MKIFFLGCLLFAFNFVLLSQDLLNELDSQTKDSTVDYTYATFKTSRLINGQSIENPANGVLLFIISHHFGELKDGSYEFYGLDQSTIRFGLEYGITDRLCVGFGRSSYQKNYDGFYKFKLLRQSTGAKKMPVSLSLFSSINIISLKWEHPEWKNYFTSRLAYCHQILIARKINKKISLQITPSYIHRNIVKLKKDQNDVFAIGGGGRIKLTNRLSLNAEYFYVLPGETADNFKNSFSIGVDIETGGHVFQIHLTNSLGMFERAFITETTGDWTKGGIHLGFNITRVFTLKKHKELN